MTTAAVILAAGGSSRFTSGHKLLAPFRGRALVTWAVEHALGAQVDETFVVSGALDLADALSRFGEGITVLHNPAWPEGMATSLQCALAAARAAGHRAIVVGLADQPLIPSEAWLAVAGASAPLAVATYRGRRRNPVRLAAELWSLLPTTGDEGARALMVSQPALVTEVPCPGDPADVDTVADLEQFDGPLPLHRRRTRSTP